MKPIFPVEVEATLETRGVDSSGVGITVIITTYNYERFLNDALNSVLRQTHPNIELIVVDDCSTDGSETTARQWANAHAAHFSCVRILRHMANYGLAQSRNTAFENASNDLIFVLDADNELYPTALEKLLRACTARNAHAAYSQLEYFGEMKGIGVADTWSRDRFLQRNYIDAMALVRKSAWVTVGGYSQLEISGWEDYDFWCKFIEHDFVGIYVPEILCRYRVHKSSMINQETNPNVDLLTYEMIFRHPWLELELNNISTPVLTSPDPVLARTAWRQVTPVEQMNLLSNQIEAIYRSKSWRVTAPLRLISNAVRQFNSLIARAPGALARRSAALARRQAPALYNAVAKSRVFRRIYTAVSGPRT